MSCGCNPCEYYLTLSSSLTTQTNSNPFLLLLFGLSLWSPLREREQGIAQCNGISIGRKFRKNKVQRVLYSCTI